MPAFDVYYETRELWPAREPGAAGRRAGSDPRFPVTGPQSFETTLARDEDGTWWYAPPARLTDRFH